MAPFVDQAGDRCGRGVHADKPQRTVESGALDRELGQRGDDQEQCDLVRGWSGDGSDP